MGWVMKRYIYNATSFNHKEKSPLCATTTYCFVMLYRQLQVLLVHGLIKEMLISLVVILAASM